MDRQDTMGRNEFFDRFYEEQFPRMWRYALTMLENPAIAEEVVQDAFVEVLRNLDYLMTCEKPERWLRQTVKNKVLHVLREKAQSMRRLPLLEPPARDSFSPSEELEKVEAEASEDITALKRRISEVLSQEELRSLARYLRKDTTYKDMAKETGCSVAALQKRIQRIKGKLKKIL